MEENVLFWLREATCSSVNPIVEILAGLKALERRSGTVLKAFHLRSRCELYAVEKAVCLTRLSLLDCRR
jgi:hypothetical protein